MEQREINGMHLVRLGKILNNFTILGLVFMLFTALMPVFQFLALLIVGLIFVLLIIPWILSAFQLDIIGVLSMFNPEFISELHSYLYIALPYVFGITAAFAAAAAVIFAFDKNDKHVGRIVVAAFAVAIGIIAMIMKATGVVA